MSTVFYYGPARCSSGVGGRLITSEVNLKNFRMHIIFTATLNIPFSSLFLFRQCDQIKSSSLPSVWNNFSHRTSINLIQLASVQLPSFFPRFSKAPPPQERHRPCYTTHVIERNHPGLPSSLCQRGLSRLRFKGRVIPRVEIVGGGVHTVRELQVSIKPRPWRSSV